MEEMEEKLKMGLDAQKSFAQVYEDGKMNNRIRGKMLLQSLCRTPYSLARVGFGYFQS